VFGNDFIDTVLGNSTDVLSGLVNQFPFFSDVVSTPLNFDFGTGSPSSYNTPLPGGGSPFNVPVPGGGNPFSSPGHVEPFAQAQQDAISAARQAGLPSAKSQAGGPEYDSHYGQADGENAYGQTGQSATLAVPPQGPYQDDARKVAANYGIDPDIFVRQINQESGFNPTAKSKAGAAGIAQFMPGTAAQYRVNVDDPFSSLDGAARHMRDLLQQFGGDWRLALAAYNAGAGMVTKCGGVPPFEETQKYIRAILGR
jgi:hypothetical protein